MALVVGLTEAFGSIGSMFSVGWFLSVLENMAVLAVIVHFVLPEIQHLTCEYVGNDWCDWAPEIIESGAAR
jgi:hypothetical protein|eukprot:COSAG06_NODE_6490_length_2910_cov_1.143619_2_plen_71_part_00